ncbi:MAG TPA: glycosyltransferase family 2 protein [Candidatus Saccharibacteria bacterium]|nr:glycosyltransferase family 2 protein [Candidatus Saccharibacteria bacterium]
MTDIEIPYEKDRRGHYRFFEMLPGIISWTMILVPFILSFIDVRLAAMFVFIYLLINFARGMAGAFRAVQGYRAMNQHQKLPWSDMLKELSMGTVSQNAKRPKWHTNVVQRSQTQPILMPPEQIIHAVIIATYKEAREVLEPTIQSVLRSDFNMKQVIFVLAYEERAGESTERLAHQLVDEYKSKFLHAMAVKHPHNIPGEVIGKGGNVTFAARRLQEYLEANHIDPLRVMVTTLDADNRPDKNYLNALSYVYLVAPDPIHKSYQPVSLYTNNIWDAPAPSRVLATGNSFFNLVVSLRQHALRNFSSHAQPMAALIKTDYWSVRTIVEDGHQFWRSYFRFDGKYRVLPLHLPIYQDAVLAETYVKTLKAQFVQLRRWTYGASDIAYVVDKGFFKPNKVPKPDLLAKTWRLLEGHVTWAVGPILVLFGGFIPSLFHPKSYTANELPIIVSRVQTVALVIALVTVFLALKTLPPKPARYKRHRSLFMVLQWVYLPLTSLVYNSFAAFYSQTRLLLGKYMSKFDFTEKAVVTQNADGSKGKTKV